jgi:hypothetical protein
MSLRTRALCDRPLSALAMSTMAVFSAGVRSRARRLVLYTLLPSHKLSLRGAYCSRCRGTRTRSQNGDDKVENYQELWYYVVKKRCAKLDKLCEGLDKSKHKAA